MRLVGSIGLKSEPEMEQEFEDALRFFDKDGRGLINAQQLKSALQSYGEPLENEDLNELMRMADAKGDGKIDYLGTDLYHRFYPLVWIGILAAAFFSVWSQISRKVSKINCFCIASLMRYCFT